MSAEPRYDCVCVGILVADHFCHPIPAMPRAGELVMAKQLSLGIGGCAANVAVDLAKLGRRVAVVARVGDDVFGGFVSRQLAAAGVDTSHLIVTPGVDTAGTLIVNVQGEDRRFIHSPGANDLFSPADFPVDLLAETRLVYVGGFLLMPRISGRDVAGFFSKARARGVGTMLDVVIPAGATPSQEDLQAALPHTDVFVPNVDEALALTGNPDPIEQARRLNALGAKTVVVTCGQAGSVFVEPGQAAKASGFVMPFVDGTGSGDAFAAGYMHGWLDGKSTAECVTTGSALGASCVRAAGASAGVFTRSEMDEFLASHSLTIQRIDEETPCGKE
jgi:sugar/nucleoside kinase (ribokinase family)